MTQTPFQGSWLMQLYHRAYVRIRRTNAPLTLHLFPMGIRSWILRIHVNILKHHYMYINTLCMQTTKKIAAYKHHLGPIKTQKGLRKTYVTARSPNEIIGYVKPVPVFIRWAVHRWPVLHDTWWRTSFKPKTHAWAWRFNGSSSNGGIMVQKIEAVHTTDRLPT